jgi:hypothetical protein
MPPETPTAADLAATLREHANAPDPMAAALWMIAWADKAADRLEECAALQARAEAAEWAIAEYLDVLDNAPDESSTSDLRAIIRREPGRGIVCETCKRSDCVGAIPFDPPPCEYQTKESNAN